MKPTLFFGFTISPRLLSIAVLVLCACLITFLSRTSPLDTAIPKDEMGRRRYNNTCLGVTSEHTPDPFFTYANGKFYLTFTANDRIPMWEACNLLDFWDKPVRGPVWTPPQDSEYSARLWAPELHALRGRWYIYFAAMNPRFGNRTHRMYVLGGPSAHQDPHAGPWEFLGPIRGMDQRQWAIDGTVFEIDGKLYFCYSGWPLDRPWNDYDERTQQLFIILLDDPITAASPACMISKPEHGFEHTGATGINEGPQWVESPDSGKTWRGLVYSCAASWTPDYKMNTLGYRGGNPLNASSWHKGHKPLLRNSPDGTGPYGPGHGGFLNLGGETIALFHATDRTTDGASNRKCRMQRVLWTNEGPYMGDVVGPFTRDVTAFLGGSQTGSLDQEVLMPKDSEHKRVLQDLEHALTRQC